MQILILLSLLTLIFCISCELIFPMYAIKGKNKRGKPIPIKADHPRRSPRTIDDPIIPKGKTSPVNPRGNLS